MRLTYRPQSPAGARLGCLVVFLREEDTRAPAHLDLPLREALGRALALKAFGGKAGASFTVLTGSSRLPRLLLVGLGKGADVTREALRRAAGTAAQQLAAMDLTGAGVCFPAGLKAADGAGEALAEGLLLGAYAFEHYKALPSGPPRKRLARIEVFDPARLASAGSVAAGVIRGNAVRLARDLGNQPANAMTPARLADEARALARRRGLKVRVLERSELERLGMGLFLGVAQGSRQPPKLIALEYRAPKAKGTLAFVGKGITFDSGGISIKPAQAMDEMKFDMCGAAAVLGALDAIAQFGPPVNVVGIIPACENLPGGASVKPGDILKSYSGKHVEVLNTDAEGRLILADALAWALKTFRPDAVVDLATLTGACVIALGHYATGAISNNETFQEQVVQAGRRTGEIVWPLPNFPEYGESLKGKYADLQNIGAREGGAITAGLFLRHFVGDVPWVHLDIAGTAWGVKNIGHIPNEGATGVGVRLLADLAAEWTPSSGGGRKARGSAKK